jgi:hypothetical protein
MNYSAKFSLSDDKSSGGTIRKPRRSKVVLKMEYSKQCKKFWDLCRTLSKRNHLCRTVTTMCQSLSRNHPLWTRTTMSPFFHRRISPPWPWPRLSTSMPLFGASTILGNLGLRIRCGIILMSLTSWACSPANSHMRPSRPHCHCQPCARAAHGGKIRQHRRLSQPGPASRF